MGTEPVISKSFLGEKNENLRIDYFVTDGPCLTDGAGEVTVFGLSIQLFSDSVIADTSEIGDISLSKDVVIRIAQLLAKNTVTPATFSDVIQDIVAAQI